MELQSLRRGVARGRPARHGWSTLSLIVVFSLVLAACGGDDTPAVDEPEPEADSEAADTDEVTDGAATEAGGELVMFVPTGSNTYVAQWIEGARAEAEALGYTPLIVENNFDQTEQDTQVQQQLASGGEVAGYIWWPSDAAAGLASLRRLAETGVPVVQTNQTPLEEAWPNVTAYAGVDDRLNGRTAGSNVMAARDALVERGVELSSPEGNMVVMIFPAGYQAGDDRFEGLQEGMADAPLNVIRQEYIDFTADAAYQAMSQLYPVLSDEGIDVVVVGDDGQSPGVIRALREVGREPGVDIMVVSTTCKSSGELQASGEVFATGVQPPLFEGQMAVDVLARLVDNGGVTSGESFEAPADQEEEPDLSGDPAQFNSMPNPPFVAGHESPEENRAAVDEFRLWGRGLPELCSAS